MNHFIRYQHWLWKVTKSLTVVTVNVSEIEEEKTDRLENVVKRLRLGIDNVSRMDGMKIDVR
ncbi:2105_t:CDS:2 [Entrophospora sp. SA101]|nr:2105_t:CDS:2 [Entrophospora sp. SA101]